MDRANLQKEVSSLSSEIDRIAESANFNGIKLLNGDLAKTAADGVSSKDGNLNLADGVTINAPVDGAGKQHTMDITFKGGLFNAGDEIAINMVKADGSEETLKLTYDKAADGLGGDADLAARADGKFGGTTAEDQAKNIANALNAKYGGDAGVLKGYVATATADAATGEMKITLTAEAQGEGKISLKEGNEVKITDKRISATAADTSVDGKDAIRSIVSGLTQSVSPIGYSADGTANTIIAGDTLDFTFKVNGNDMHVKLTATDDATVGANQFKVGAGQTEEELVKSIQDALNKAQFTDKVTTVGGEDVSGAIDEGKLKVSDFFEIGQSGNSLTIGVKDSVGNNNTDNYRVTDIDLTSGTTTKAVLDGATVKADTFIIQNQDGKGLDKINEWANNNTITIKGTTKDGKSFEMELKAASAENTGDNEFKLDTSDEAGTLTSIINVLKSTDATATIDGIASQSINGMFVTATGAGTENFVIAANGDNTGIEFTTVQGTAAATDKFVNTFENNYGEGDKMTVRGTLRDGSSFSVELTATNKDAANLDANEFKIGDDLDGTLANIKAALEKDTTEIKVNDADSNVKGADIFGTSANGKEIEITTATGELRFTANTAGKLGKGGASGVTDLTVTPASNFEVITGGTAGKVAGHANNTLTFDANSIEQGTTLTVDGKTYEFVTDEKYISKGGEDGNIAIKVANLGNGASDAEIAKAVYDTLTQGSTQDTPTGDVHSANLKDNADYKVKYSAGSNSVVIESIEQGTEAKALTDVKVSSGVRDSAVVKFETTTTGLGTAAKTSLNVKAGDSVTVNGKVFEFVEEGKRTKDENAVAVKLDYAGSAEDAAKALADAINEVTANSTNNEYNVLATSDAEGNVSLVSRYNPHADKVENAYKKPEVQLPKSGGLTLQVGETSEDFQKVNVAIDKMDAKSLGIGDISVGKQEDAAAAIDKIKAAINTVSSTRGDLGAIQNRLEHTINNLGVTTENMTAAESRIRDTDMAKEMMEFTKNNILVQASQAMLAQANQLPQGVLQLLQ